MTDGYLLDTNVACALWDVDDLYHLVATAFIESVGFAPVFISPVVFGEILYGLEVFLGTANDRRRELFAKLEELGPESIAVVTRHTAREYGRIRAALFREFGSRDARGRVREKRPEQLLDSTSSRELGIQENDLWLSAQAVERNLVLVSRDSKIERIKGVFPELRLRILEQRG